MVAGRFLGRRGTGILAAAVLAMASGCQQADPFLFNGEKVSSYQLPDNDIPAADLEAVTFNSGGNTLYGYWVKAGTGGAPAPLTWLYFHGNEHNIDTFWHDVMRLHKTGANVLIFDYRGYGLSEGASTSDSTLNSDAEAALAFTAAQGVVPADLCLYGFSLGNVGMLHLAATAPGYRCLVAQSAFASIDALIQGSTFLPLPDGWVNHSKFDNVAAVKAVSAPLLVLHGDSDATARFEDNGRVLYDAAPAPKRLLLVAGAGHTNLPDVMGEALYVQTLTQWLTSQK